MHRLALGCAMLAAAFAASSTAADDQLGSISFPTSGSVAAQPHFVRGVAALHSFWYEEALKEFQAAEAIDPGFAMAAWGETMTFNHPIWLEQDLDGARKALNRLGATPQERAAKAPTAREKEYLDAVEILFGDGDKAARDLHYEAAMARLARDYPDDVEAQAFHALSILGTMKRDEPDARKQIRAAAILEPLFAAHPDHPGVLHYLIHAYDDPVHAPLGLRAARRYARVAPAAHHALHMPSHIFVQLGMWDDAIDSNRRAWDTSKAWVERDHLGSAKRDLHSLQWLQYALLQEGRNAEARQLLEEVAPARGASDRERSARVRMAARYAVETGEPIPLDAADLKRAASEDSPSGSYAHESDLPLLLARGLAAVHAGDLAAAAHELEQLSRSQAEAKNDAGAVMENELEAAIALKKGQASQATAAARRAVEIEERMGAPSGPPDDFVPAHELYGEILLQLGRAAEALEQFRASLLRTPNRARSIAGAAAAAREARDPAAGEYGRALDALRARVDALLAPSVATGSHG
jgi:hypothetical protein